MSEFLSKLARDTYERRETQVTREIAHQIERWVSLQVIDSLWMDHLDAIDDLREGIGLRGYGQRDPLVEYKNEAFSMFERLIAGIDSEIVHRIFKVQVQLSPNQTNLPKVTNAPAPPQRAVAQPTVSTPTTQASGSKPSHKLGRNDPCPCGSGKKWKKCHYPQLG